MPPLCWLWKVLAGPVAGGAPAAPAAENELGVGCRGLKEVPRCSGTVIHWWISLVILAALRWSIVREVGGCEHGRLVAHVLAFNSNANTECMRCKAHEASDSEELSNEVVF